MMKSAPSSHSTMIGLFILGVLCWSRVDSSPFTEWTNSSELGRSSKASPETAIFGCKTTDLVANCSHLQLSAIPTNLPPTIQTLILSHNHLTSVSLKNRTLSRYSELRTLIMDRNKINSSLPSDSFYGLERLEELNLYRNEIRMNAELNSSLVFEPLKSLKRFNFTKNWNASDPTLKYPDQALSYLTSLEDLRIDGLANDTKFGDGFLKLRNLTKLTMVGFTAGHCKISALKNDTFINVPNLELLNISDCLLDKRALELDALAPLQSLEVLDVSNNYYYFGMDALADLLYGQRNNKNLKRLRMERVMARYSPCTIIYEDTTKNLKHTGLERLEARYNQIELIEIGALKNLPKTLNYIDMRDNKIMFGAYWKDMHSLTNLTHIILDGQNEPNAFPGLYPREHIDCSHKKRPYDFSHSPEDVSISSCSGAGPCVGWNNEIILPLPPNLKYASIQGNGVAYVVENIEFNTSNSLEKVDLSYNKFLRLYGPVKGLNQLRHFNMSGSFVEIIGSKFFDHFPELISIDLYENLIYQCIQKDDHGKIFGGLHKLEMLNISVNAIVKIPYNAFSSLYNLRHLSVASNTLQYASFKISHMDNLQHLDLRENQILSLPKSTRDHISKLVHRGVPVVVDMRFNPISCECSNLDFLQWVVDTEVFGSNFTSYYCSYPSRGDSLLSVHVPSDGYATIVRHLHGECIQHKSLFLLVLGSCLLIVLVVMVGILHRFRWTLRYWYHAAKLKMASNQRRTLSAQDFQFDVFVSYAREDESFVFQELKTQLENQLGVKLCIHERDFAAGGNIHDNIYCAVTSSRKTLVVVTPHLLKSKWCRYEVQMAQQEGISKGRDVLVFLFQDEKTTKSRDHDILQYVKTNTYVTYPAIPRYRNRFWRKLATDLKK